MKRFLRILLASGITFIVSTSEAATRNVYIDPFAGWNGFENLYDAKDVFLTNRYFAPGTATFIQGSINRSGLVVCAPDIVLDRDLPFDTNFWADASGSSTGICRVLSTFYIDSTTVAAAGDRVIFSGVLLSNSLAQPYADTAIAFIKDFDSGWGLHGMASIPLRSLTNGQPFTLSKTIAALGAANHVQWGFEWSGPPARSNSVAQLGKVVLAPSRSTVGASVPWITYEAEDMIVSGGTILGPDYLPGNLAAEASGRQCVRLNGAGQYVEFVAQAAANALVLRYSVPDSVDGTGADYTLSLYVNGSFLQKLPLSSRYSWRYGSYPFNNNPLSGAPRNFFDELRVAGLSIHAGDQIRFQVDDQDTAAFYVADLVDLENVALPLVMPAGALSVTSYGAVAGGTNDCTSAFRNCLAAAHSNSKSAWIPPGTYLLTGNVDLPPGTVLQGAGMWYTRLIGSDALYNTAPTRRLNLNGTGSNIHLSDFCIIGFLNYRNDSEGNDGIGGAYGTGSSLSRLWIEHTKAGAWILNSSNLLVDDCRFRNTLADGINVNRGMRGTVVTNCTARGVGDDAFAIWPSPGTAVYPDGQNLIIHCTGQLPALANGGAVYGGESNRIEHCLFSDIPYGCGILFSTTFPIGAPFRGVAAEGCELFRCGGYDPGYGWRAALQLCLDNYTNGIPGTKLRQMTINDSISDGLSVIGGAGSLSNAFASDVTISRYGLGAGGRNALWSRNDAKGTMTFSNSLIFQYRDDSPHFSFNFIHPPAQPILSLSLIEGAQLGLTYAAMPGANYQIESTPDLIAPAWKVIPGSTTNAVDDTVTLVFPWSPGTPVGFFRSVSP